MVEELPEYTPVIHIKDGYKGWIYDTTRSKAYFTGNVNCDWQYRIWVAEEDIRIAPIEDLRINMDSPKMPPFINQTKDSSSRYRKETPLHALGYRISDMSRVARKEILEKVAIPYLGPSQVAKTITGLIYGRTKSVEKNYNAIIEWMYDLDMLLEQYDFSVDVFDDKLIQYIMNTKAKLVKIRMKMSLYPEDIEEKYNKKKKEASEGN